MSQVNQVLTGKSKTIASIVFLVVLAIGVIVPELAGKAEAISGCIGTAFTEPSPTPTVSPTFTPEGN